MVKQPPAYSPDWKRKIDRSSGQALVVLTEEKAHKLRMSGARRHELASFVAFAVSKPPVGSAL